MRRSRIGPNGNLIWDDVATDQSPHGIQRSEVHVGQREREVLRRETNVGQRERDVRRREDEAERAIELASRQVEIADRQRRWADFRVALMTGILIAGGILSFGALSYSGVKVIEEKRQISQSDKLIAAAQQEASQEIAKAETNAANRIAEVETAAQAKIADTNRAKHEAIRQAEKDAQVAITKKTQELEAEFEMRVAPLKDKEKELDTKIKENDDTKEVLKSEKAKIASDRKQVEEQIRTNSETKKELATALEEMQEMTEAAEQRKKKLEARLNQVDVDIVAFDNFVRNRNTLLGKNEDGSDNRDLGYWYWRGRNTNDEPILGAAKIIGISDLRVHLEDTKGQKFSVYIRSLTKEQQALIGILSP